MARESAAERLARVENEMLHAWESIKLTRQENREALDALRTEFAEMRQSLTLIRETLSRYAQTGLLMAGAALAHSAGAPAAKASGELLKHALKLLLQ